MGGAELINVIITVSSMVNFISSILEKILPEKAVLALLFDGKIREKHKTKYALAAITDRYKGSINGFNKAVAFNIGFVVIALYGYIVLLPTEKVAIPLVGLSVSRQAWITIVPLISYGLQTLIFTSFIWFMILRLGMKLLYKEVGAIDDFGDITNILLDGSLGHMWIILRITQYFKSKWNLVWAVPVMILLLATITSPILICIYFIVQLSGSGSNILAALYSILLIPYAALFLLLIATAAILGIGEISYASKNQVLVEIDGQRIPLDELDELDIQTLRDADKKSL